MSIYHDINDGDINDGDMICISYTPERVWYPCYYRDQGTAKVTSVNNEDTIQVNGI